MLGLVVLCGCADPPPAAAIREKDATVFTRPDVAPPPPAWRDASVDDAADASDDAGAIPDWMGPILLTSRSALYTFDPARRAVRYLVDYRHQGRPLNTVVDIALTADGRLLLGTEEHHAADVKVYSLFEADIATGEARLLYQVPNGLIGLEVDRDDVVVTGGFGLRMFELASGELAGAVPGSATHRVSGDVALMPDQTLIYTVFEDQRPVDALYRFRPGRAAPERIALMALRNVWGLVHADGALWAFTQDGAMARVDPETAEVIERFELRDDQWYGATRAP